MEMITMPKSGFGSRPIGVMSPPTRVLYEAAVDRLHESLPEQSRDQNFSEFRQYGLKNISSPDVWIVDFDIAACYEYVNHSILENELLLQSLDTTGAKSLREILSNLFPQGHGIPQASASSHRLADAYLSIMERDLLRKEYNLIRYADDFRIVVDDLPSAHQAIEDAVESARNIGLTLSEAKTRISKPADLTKEEDRQADLLDKYKKTAADGLRSIEWIEIDYDEYIQDEVDATDQDIDYTALLQIIEDWVHSIEEAPPFRLVEKALTALRHARERVPKESLMTIAFRLPVRVRPVVVYLLNRPEAQENWEALSALTKFDRLGPWAKLWLLRAAGELYSKDENGSSEVIGWAKLLLSDKFEVVRADAAWLLAVAKEISTETVASLYVEASPVTQTGLAAVAGHLDGGNRKSKLSEALRVEHALVRAAFSWGSTYANQP